jgi:hypothetical protein
VAVATPTSSAAKPTGSATAKPTVEAPSSTSSSSAQQATTQTFSLVGGTAAVSFSPSGVQVLWATAKPGFDVNIQPESPGFKVEFRSEDHRSRLDVWWSGGPQHTVREQPE